MFVIFSTVYNSTCKTAERETGNLIYSFWLCSKSFLSCKWFCAALGNSIDAALMFSLQLSNAKS